MRFPARDVLLEWKLFLQRCAEQMRGTTYGGLGLPDWLCLHVSDGDLCFDVGANIGRFADVLLRCGGRVVCVEPQRTVCHVLEKLYSGDNRVSIEQVALGPADGKASLRTGSSHTLASLSGEWMAAVTTSGRFGAHRWSHQEIVGMTTLNSLIRRYGRPQLCKIDVEGFEDKVLGGLSERIPVVTLEYTAEASSIAVRAIERLQSLGAYRFNITRGETADFVFPSFRGALVVIDTLLHMSARGLEWGNVVALDSTSVGLSAANL